MVFFFLKSRRATTSTLTYIHLPCTTLVRYDQRGNVVALGKDMAFRDRHFRGKDGVRHAPAIDPRFIGAERGRIEARGDDRLRHGEGGAQQHRGLDRKSKRLNSNN